MECACDCAVVRADCVLCVEVVVRVCVCVVVVCGGSVGVCMGGGFGSCGCGRVRWLCAWWRCG